jgi:hypothetical protein
MRQIAIALLFGFFSITAWTQDGAAIKDDDAAAVRAAAVTDEYRLTSIKTTCLYFDTVDKGKAYLVRVREKHSKECGGDPETSNTVFFMKLRKRDGHATTTAYNVNGKFQELKPLAKGGQESKQ